MLTFPHCDIDLDTTLFCGQTFRWKRLETGGFAGNVAGRAVRAETREGALCLFGAEEADAPFWRAYFDLSTDYEALLAPVLDERLRCARAACQGLRLLNQPFFETLCSFILSANNNMRRITAIVERLCALTEPDENGLHPFPTSQEILRAGRAFVDGIGAGYRAPYLFAAAERVQAGFDGEALRALPYEEAARALRAFPGVGEKVADCVLLFACGKRDVFPVDTWMEKALTQWYGFTGTRSRLKAQAAAHFGPAAGLAQQLLFAYAVREKPF